MVSEIIRTAWQRWRIIGEVFSDMVGRFIAVLFYFTIFVPFALIAKFGDPLNVRKPVTKWLERGTVSRTLDDARRQF